MFIAVEYSKNYTFQKIVILPLQQLGHIPKPSKWTRRVVQGSSPN